MANKLYEEKHIQNIADAIREKTGKTDSLLVSAMAEEITSITGSEDLTNLVDLLGDGEIDESSVDVVVLPQSDIDEIAALLGGDVDDIDSIKEHSQTLIDLANTTTGNTDTNLTDGVNALVGGYGQGGSDGIEGGYDVTFYNEQGEELAFYSVKQGHTIAKPPKYDCLAWQTSDGANITFPYMPTSDVSLYANSDTLADQLYKFYGIDKGVYPYVMFVYDSRNSATSYFYFGKSMDESKLYDCNYRTYGNFKTVVDDPNDLENMVATIMGSFSATGTWQTKSSVSKSDTSGLYYYVNFDLEMSNAIVYRLDEVAEPLPYDGLANGYDVMFYDENNEGLAFYSIKQGHSINPPEYQVKAWASNNGDTISFPYTPNADVVLYALNGTYADTLYKYYGVDKGVYPYLMVSMNQSMIAVCFSTKDMSQYDGSYKSEQRSITTSEYYANETDVETFVNFAMSKIPSLTLTTMKIYDGANGVQAMNHTTRGYYEGSPYVKTWYDLNQ